MLGVLSLFFPFTTAIFTLIRLNLLALCLRLLLLIAALSRIESMFGLIKYLLLSGFQVHGLTVTDFSCEPFIEFIHN